MLRHIASVLSAIFSKVAIRLIVFPAMAVTMAVPTPTAAGLLPQGPKLVGSGATGNAVQGEAVALSADGNTALVGGPGDSNNTGAAWVFVRDPGGAWAQQGTKLVGTGSIGTATQGVSVALSADGNTAIVGAPFDSSSTGAAWIFVRENGVWSQQGPKLVATDAVGRYQGFSVALSADGNTALIGSSNDNNNTGAAWVWKRDTGGVWTQDGPKLVGAGAVGTAYQGYALSLSADGALAAIGGYLDSSGTGAVWIWTRGPAGWTQQGPKLAASGSAYLGYKVALSGDGSTLVAGGGGNTAWVFAQNAGAWSLQAGPLALPGDSNLPSSVAISNDGTTALVGSYSDSNNLGAAWQLRRGAGGVWKVVGAKVTGPGEVGNGAFGLSAALSADGRTALVGGSTDANRTGAAWPFRMVGPAHDFNGDAASDILWRNGAETYLWLVDGASVTGAYSESLDQAWSAIGQRDFNGDGKNDLLWVNGDQYQLWLMDGATRMAVRNLGAVPSWTIAGIGDFDGDGVADILWSNAAGDLAIWFFSDGNATRVSILGNVPTTWAVAGVADINADGYADIIWRESGGAVAIWTMTGDSVSAVTSVGSVATSWSIVGFGDFNGDRKADILWREAGGSTAAWLMNDAANFTPVGYGGVGSGWSIQQTGDYDGDGASDILWRHSGGALATWQMNAGAVGSVIGFGAAASEWVVQGLNAY